MYAIIERELILDLFEAVSGRRRRCATTCAGGVAHDLPERIQSTAAPVNDRVRDFITSGYLRELINDRLPRAIDQTNDLLTTNEIITNRCIGVGVLSREDAIAYSAAGPVLRASSACPTTRAARSRTASTRT